MPSFFDVKCWGFAHLQLVISLIFSDLSHLQKFANDLASIPSNRLLRKMPSFFPCFCGAKIVIFRKCRKLFAQFIHLRNFYSFTCCQDSVKTLEMRHLRKPHFSQMFLRLWVSTSQRARSRNMCYTTAIFTGSFFFTGGMYSIRAKPSALCGWKHTYIASNNVSFQGEQESVSCMRDNV